MSLRPFAVLCERREAALEFVARASPLAAHRKRSLAVDPTEDAPAAPSSYHNPVNLSVPEKLVQLLLFLQQYALLWITAKSWAWPVTWEKWSRWTLAFNIDLVGLSSYRPAGVTAVSSSQSRFGQHARYWTYALPWALTMMVTVALPTALHFVFQRRLSVRLNAIVAFARNVALMCAVLLYTPVCVALSRLYVCEHKSASGHFVLAVDPTVSCFSDSHWVMMVLFGFPFFGTLLGLPAWLLLQVNRIVVHRGHQAKKHERYLLWKEMEYEYGLSFDWLHEHMWLLSSFTRRRVHQYAVWLLSQGFLIAVYTWARSSPQLQADLYFVVSLAWLAAQVAVPTFRVPTSNALVLVTTTCMALNTWFSVMRAHGMKSAVVVDSNYVIAMLVLNVAAAFALACVAVFAFKRRRVWPSALALGLVREALEARPHHLSRFSWKLCQGTQVHVLPPATRGAKRKIEPEDVDPTQPPASPQQPRSVKLDIEPLEVTYFDDDYPDRDAPSLMSKHPSKRRSSTRVLDVMAYKELTWMAALCSARDVACASLLLPPSLMNAPLLEARMNTLGPMWTAARAEKSVLAWSLLETIDDLSRLIMCCQGASYWSCVTFESASASLSVRLRERPATLMSARKQGILLKMLAVAAWLQAGRKGLPPL